EEREDTATPLMQVTARSTTEGLVTVVAMVGVWAGAAVREEDLVQPLV
ncbi:MAG: hypothetical protein H6Q48_3085, partial [Deltaproteobacteria bacterium]|nr:hypothetical protein [Deltaproteobacteria bacterium]